MEQELKLALIPRNQTCAYSGSGSTPGSSVTLGSASSTNVAPAPHAHRIHG
ncbi:hypothetical protein CBOM_01942 [Ceraceosorus bombacis]|uniref:Uncharacterized protein n=1 Tax=Ceraceosorus bombacis TaxID=401625 RepID=A0A0P1BDE6_9BASI|nr:hypothetical protein CBOM_01942 [Ceraceosorus bombacis]